MNKLLPFLLLVTLGAPAVAQGQPALSLEQKMQLRCSAAFAIIANEQQRGVRSELTFPPLGERGKEFAVRAGARLMDELKLSREQYQALFKAEVEALQKGSMEAGNAVAYVDRVMQPCLSALEASGL